jgi:lipopolysaccharide/colanic/teichoic acid biosynthesis glycosyltransferase
MAKRIFDLFFASLFSIIFLPVSLIVAIGLKIESPHLPVIFGGARVSKGGRIFTHYRFRTMAGEPLRKTPFGQRIGNLSLDGIPTLWNVLNGDMSLIGPRPEVPEDVDLADADWQKVLSIKPGCASLGVLILLERYNDASVKERIQPEVYYVEHQSLLFDLRLIGRTLRLWLKMGHLKGGF